MAQEQRKKSAPAKTEQTEETKPEARAANVDDELLDEIDSVLEANAAEFVAGYVQKGGQVFIFLVVAAAFVKEFI